jgi:oligopeptide transport system substrate-binding protein
MRRWTWIAWLLITSLSLAACTGPAADPTRTARILMGAPGTLDPAAQGDSGSAAVTAQLFESLTTFDADRQARPALAESWRIEDGGRRIVFHLREDLTFSDGSPLRPTDVVRSWMRLIDPDAPSPLVSLMLDVKGAQAFVSGQSDDPATVGLHADDATGDVTVDLVRPAADFVEVVASPTFGIVPPGVGQSVAALTPGPDFVGSGGYVLSEAGTTLHLQANERYWAGTPAISTILLVGDTAGRSPLELFEADELDYTPIAAADASWIAYDATLGPQLLEVPSLSVAYYGFDVRQRPFDDVRVRQAFGMAIDWRRIAELGSTAGAADVANSLVPPGIPGRSDRDFVPKHDPDAARALLAQAGYPGGVGFPKVTFMTGGGAADAAILADLKRELGVSPTYEAMSDGYFERMASDPPAMWSMGWVADYPGRNDFLGILLGSGSSNNYGHYSSSEFDAAIAAAGAATDPATATAAYDQAETIVQRDVPVVPLSYGTDWALARTGLTGAGQNGLGILRMAGLAWAD